MEIRPETNEVVIGDNADVFYDTLYATKLNFMSIEDLDGAVKVTGKIRYSHQGAPCTVEKVDDDIVKAVFDEPVRAITPGQAVVFYDGDIVVGGGTIIGRNLK